MTRLTNAYCDKITITSPNTFPQLAQDYRDLVESIGGHVHRYESEYIEMHLPKGGKLVVQDRKHTSTRLARVTLNGRVCAELRLLQKFASALAIVSQHPHRVTEVHAKIDIIGGNTPKLLRKVNTALHRDGILGYPAAKCQQFPKIRPDGSSVTNLYVPDLLNKAEKQIVYYDKRLEQHQVHGMSFENDEVLSIEFRATGRLTRSGLSVHDAHNPSPMFWHYMDKCPLIGKHRPKWVGQWANTGSGYELPKYVRRTPLEEFNDITLYGGDWMRACALALETGKQTEFLKQIKARLQDS